MLMRVYWESSLPETFLEISILMFAQWNTDFVSELDREFSGNTLYFYFKMLFFKIQIYIYISTWKKCFKKRLIWRYTDRKNIELFLYRKDVKMYSIRIVIFPNRIKELIKIIRQVVHVNEYEYFISDIVLYKHFSFI